MSFVCLTGSMPAQHRLTLPAAKYRRVAQRCQISQHIINNAHTIHLLPHGSPSCGPVRSAQTTVVEVDGGELTTLSRLRRRVVTELVARSSLRASLIPAVLLPALSACCQACCDAHRRQTWIYTQTGR